MVNEEALLAEVREINAHVAAVRAVLAREARNKDTGLTSGAHAMTLHRLDEAIHALTMAANNVQWPNGQPGAGE